MIKRSYIVFLTVLLMVIFTGSLSYAREASSGVLMMATTTSTDNTGLLEYLAPIFKEDTGIELRWTATGTGKAIALGRNCDVDIVFVHAPDEEKKFVEDGFGIERVEVMYNDFIIVGPPDDPVGIRGKSAIEALEMIARTESPFASRGDKSGTHVKELELWKASSVSIPEKESWYIQTGQGMINTLVVAQERDAYCLTDRGTYITWESRFQDEPPLVILVEGDAALRNQYSVIAVNPEKCENAKSDLAKAFIDWIVSPKGQQLIADFKILGKQLFVPNAGDE